jgi:tRNA A37 threonylcarbamoyladenosine synthetase subunit TsaC/SUA5/YrdC
MRDCNCRLCKRIDRIDAIKQKGDHREMIALVDELHESLMNVEEDVNYENSIADGSWPQAVEILTHRLARAKEKQDKCPDST